MPRKTNENKELDLTAKKGETKANSAVNKKATTATNRAKASAKTASKTSTKTAKTASKASTGKAKTTAKASASKTTKKATPEADKSAKVDTKAVKKVAEKTSAKTDKTKTEKTTTTKKSTTISSKTTTKKPAVKSTETTKKTTKSAKTGEKAQAEKVSSATKTATSKSTKKLENDVATKQKEEIKQETVIQKIKNFIAKIIAMQEEARKEDAEKALAKMNGLAKEKDNVKETKNKKSVTKIDTPYMLEYYDLPYRYNETVVKILAQTPKRLFVYWDISDGDREKYLKAFGEKFFEETYPVLLVHNEEKNYTFEVPINDFANSWYLDINDPKSNYVIQLGRKFRRKPEKVNILASSGTADVVLNNDYVPIITSNILEVPNDHILFENLQTRALYRNVKNGKETYIDINNKEFAKRMGHIYSIYDIYKEIYKNEIDNESLFDLLNPSSMSSSTFK